LTGKGEERTMAVDEIARQQLRRHLEDVLSEDDATTLMGSLPPVDWADVATKTDLAALGDRLDARLDAWEKRWEDRFGASEKRWDDRFGASEERWDGRFGASEKYWDARFRALEQRWDARFRALEQRWDARHEAMLHRIEASEHRLLATFRGEVNTAITGQTRLIIFALVGGITANTSLVLAAARFGG
jgi:hypothetical protein